MRTLFLALLALTFIPLTSPAMADLDDLPHANVAGETRTPLVIIRFSQRNVYYDKALYNATRKATEVKPDVNFDVVLFPGLRSTSSESNLTEVVQSLRKIGIPGSHVAPQLGPTSGKRYDEIHVFVR